MGWIKVSSLPNDIAKFEKTTKSIGAKGKEIQNDGYTGCKQVNLLLISDGTKQHYAAIKNMSRLLASQNNKHEHAQYKCFNFLQLFNSVESRDQHQDYCMDNEAVKIEMPQPGSTVKFQDGQKQLRAPYIMYVYTETLQRPAIKNLIANTKKINEHIPSDFYIHTEFTYDESYNLTKSYWDEDLTEKAAEHLEQEAIRLANVSQKDTMIPLTPKEWRRHNSATKCHICKREYMDPKNAKVKDHCHYTQKYRGPAHRNCNLAYRIP